MSGSSGSRDDGPTGGSGGGGGGGGGTGGGDAVPLDPCLRLHRGAINSPKEIVLRPIRVGDILQVRVNATGTRPILIVADTNGKEAGSLTFPGYLQVIECIRDRQFRYKAVVEKISGGIYEVRVEPVV